MKSRSGAARSMNTSFKKAGSASGVKTFQSDLDKLKDVYLTTKQTFHNDKFDA